MKIDRKSFTLQLLSLSKRSFLSNKLDYHSRCPQCTITLWRVPHVEEGSLLESLVKVTAAMALVSIPLTTITLYTCFKYHIFTSPDPIEITRGVLLGIFGLFSVPIYFMEGYGLWFSWERRGTLGLRWWGGDLEEAQIGEAATMTMMFFTPLALWWMISMSVTLEAYVGPFAPGPVVEFFGRKWFYG